LAEQPISKPEEPPQKTGLPEDKIARSLRYSVWDAGYYASMVGFAETYFIPLLIFIGASTLQVGIFSAAPQLFVALSQFVSLLLVERLLVRKRIIVASSSLQSLCLFAIAYGTITGKLTPWAMIIIGILYYAFNGMTLPPWNSLMGDLTSKANRGEYFGKRNGTSQLVSFTAIVIGGLILQYFKNIDSVSAGFSLIIILAFVSRLGSVYSTSRHFEAPYRKNHNAYFSFWEFLKRSPKSNFAHFVFLISLMNLAVYTAAPYFAVYMLRDLEFSYLQYTVAQGIFIAVQFITMRRWGPISDRYGNRIVLLITGLIMPVIPILWFMSRNFFYIVVIQVFSGICWAGWMIAVNNFIFDAVTPAKRARCAAYLNFFNSTGICLGSLLGAFLSIHAPSSINTGAMHIIFFSSLEYIFLISAALRGLAMMFIMPAIREVRSVSPPDAHDMFVRLTSIKPFQGVRFDPFTGHSRKNGINDKKRQPGEKPSRTRRHFS